MRFYNGATDSAQAYALHRIEWHFRYNVLCGTCQDDDLFRISIPGARADALGIYPSEGTFQVQSAPLSGEQITRISWYSDEGTIKLRVMSVSNPH